jgi:predicted SprT family Zn-dependent metalloprotease
LLGAGPSSPGGRREAADDLKQHLASWAARWRFAEFERQVRVKFSHRLNHALGRADVRRWSVTLNEVLLLEQNRDHLLTTLCHEAAHIAAFRRHGVFISQHGPEWQSLVRAAGFQPRASTRVEEVFGLAERLAAGQRRYEYHCAVCNTREIRRSKNQWLRCLPCQRAGRDGLLTITRLPAAA